MGGKLGLVTRHATKRCHCPRRTFLQPLCRLFWRAFPYTSLRHILVDIAQHRDSLELPGRIGLRNCEFLEHGFAVGNSEGEVLDGEGVSDVGDGGGKLAVGLEGKTRDIVHTLKLQCPSVAPKRSPLARTSL